LLKKLKKKMEKVKKKNKKFKKPRSLWVLIQRNELMEGVIKVGWLNPTDTRFISRSSGEYYAGIVHK